MEPGNPRWFAALALAATIDAALNGVAIWLLIDGHALAALPFVLASIAFVTVLVRWSVRGR